MCKYKDTVQALRKEVGNDRVTSIRVSAAICSVALEMGEEVDEILPVRNGTFRVTIKGRGPDAPLWV